MPVDRGSADDVAAPRSSPVSLGKRGRIIIASIAVVAVVAVSAGTYALTRSDGKSEAERERERSGSHEMREALEKHPALGDHRLPLAFVSEKLAQRVARPAARSRTGPRRRPTTSAPYPARRSPPRSRRARHAPSARPGPGPRRPRAAVQRSAAGRVPRPSRPGPRPAPTAASRSRRPPTRARRRSSPVAPPRWPGRTCRTSGCVLYAGTAGGGLWKTGNALAATRPGAPSAPTSPRPPSDRSTGRQRRRDLRRHR